MLALYFYTAFVLAFECILDNDCRTSRLSDYNSFYCVDNTCQSIRKEGEHCTLPDQCASFSYYGPLACSANCKTQSDCNNSIIENTKFCCKAIPLQGECDIDRPGHLSGCLSSHVCASVNGTAICTEKKGKSWLLGAICSILGNVLINFGVNYQKRSYIQSYITLINYQVNTLLLGSVVYTLGKIISFSAYLFGSQSMLAGLSATGLISNSIFAPVINGEVFTWKDATAIALVLVGTFIILENTSRSHIVYSLCELLKMYRKVGTMAWFAFIIVSIVCMFLFIKFVEINSDWELNDEYFQFLKKDIFFDDDGIVCRYLMVFVYVFLSSFIASFTTLSAKSLGEIVDRIISGDNLMRSFLLYFFSFTLVGCTLLQIYWLNRALKHYDALLVVPIFHISWTILSILTAGIYFQDFDHYTATQYRNFLIGVVVIFCGSIFLGSRIANKDTIDSREIDVPEKQSKKDD